MIVPDKHSSSPILVTSYENPDLDGYACAFAYAEILRQKGYDARAGMTGTPLREIGFVLQEFAIAPLPLLSVSDLAVFPSVVLVDSSEPDSLPTGFDLQRVVEVIDHRQVHEAHRFTKAHVQIELVGSCATLIAERIESQPLSVAAQQLLYSAILLNTLNFKSPLTTPRDLQMAARLHPSCTFNDTFVQRMYEYKSSGPGVMEDLKADMLVRRFGATSIAITQLDCFHASKLIQNNRSELQMLIEQLKEDVHADLCFINFLDVQEAKNYLLTTVADEQLLGQALSLSFNEGIAVTTAFLLRKQIVPLLQSFFEK